MTEGLEWEVVWSSARPTVHLLDPTRPDTHTLCGIRLPAIGEGGPFWEGDTLLGATSASNPLLPRHRRDHYANEDDAVRQRVSCERCLRRYGQRVTLA